MADGNRQQGFGFHATGASKLRHGEIVVDLFAGGGGASEALRQALGRDPDTRSAAKRSRFQRFVMRPARRRVTKMKLHELMETLQREHAEELPRWYCDLNCFRVPQGFPLALPEIEDNRKKMEHPDYRLAWNAVTCALGEEGVSRAWWLVELGKTEGEWRTWWAARKGVIAA